MQKNNITLSFKNIISFLNNLTAHFTGARKIITFSLIILMLSFVNIILCFSNNFVSALSYQSEVGIGFTFDPTLSVTLSSSDLIISNLTPGISSDSNSINVSVATNVSYGYTLSVNASSNDLVHSNTTNIFNGIATDADLVSLTADNTWGYSTSLDNGTSWSNYNGLYSSSSATLLDPTSNVSSSVDFKIAAKAGSTQASGTYTNTITFTAVTKPTPMTLAEAYASEGKTMINGFYTMQDMTSTICNKTEAIGSQLQVLDIRDHKVYWIAKLADQKCWMTQNLDLDLDSNRTYTHWDTDLGWSAENGNSVDENATWQPMHSTINFTIGSTISDWQDSYTEPYSANPGDVYFYTSNSNTNDLQYNSLQECTNIGHNDCAHYHAGNYYNWNASVANNNTMNFITSNENAPNSICPSSWKLSRTNSDNILTLFKAYNIIEKTFTYDQENFTKIRTSPLFFNKSGYIDEHNSNFGSSAMYWYGTIFSETMSRNYGLGNSHSFLGGANRYYGASVRCLTR